MAAATVAFCEQNGSEITAAAQSDCHPVSVGRCCACPYLRGWSLLRQKATAARTPALTPVASAPAPTAYTGPPTVESLGRELREVLPTRRVHSVSVCDAEANVLWLSEGALGPDEHSLVTEALEQLSADGALHCYEMGLEDGRLSLFLPVRTPDAALVGIAMVLTDGKSLGDETLERMAAQPVRTILLRLAVLMKPPEKPVATAAVEGTGAAAAATRAEPGEAPLSAEEPLSARKVNEILEFELSPEDTGHKRTPPALADVAATAPGEMVRLELVNDTAAARPPVAAAAAPRAPIPPPATARPSPTPVAAPAPITAPAPVAVAESAPAPVSDANVLLEILPFAKLRPGGQTRRFQVLARMSAPLRDPAVQDALVLQRLMSWLAAHRNTWNTQPTGFTVSLSIATLEDERFVQKLAAALNSHAIAADTLGFEIAEAVCTQRRAQVERFLAQCEKIGAWVVVDGFSFDSQTVPLLRSKALRVVKIDPKLSSAALKDKLSQAMVVAAVQAAKVLGIHCAAQKVDSQAALQWLTAIGCDFAQGTAVGRAQSLDSIGNLPETTAVTEHLRSAAKAE
jgi:EAL domain-containing protein (putative c-di-GMP-specific phosphodiesterase class I)